MSIYAKLNGKLLKQEAIAISPNNRSFRYGDGFFETLKVHKGRIVLRDLHFERLMTSLDTMQFDKPSYFNPDYLNKHILELAIKNNHQNSARIRLTVFRGEGGLHEAVSHFPNHLVQSWALNNATNQLNENGLVVGVYKEARKVCDHFSHVKSNNFLAYVMASLWVKQQRLNDGLLLNPFSNIADATIANVFIVKNDVVKTPPLSDGPVSGIMRRHLLHQMKAAGMQVEEVSMTVEDLLEADEVFLTNAIYGLKWVKQIENQSFTNKVAAAIHQQFILPLVAS